MNHAIFAGFTHYADVASGLVLGIWKGGGFGRVATINFGVEWAVKEIFWVRWSAKASPKRASKTEDDGFAGSTN